MQTEAKWYDSVSFVPAPPADSHDLPPPPPVLLPAYSRSLEDSKPPPPPPEPHHPPAAQRPSETTKGRMGGGDGPNPTIPKRPFVTTGPGGYGPAATGGGQLGGGGVGDMEGITRDARGRYKAPVSYVSPEGVKHVVYAPPGAKLPTFPAGGGWEEAEVVEEEEDEEKKREREKEAREGRQRSVVDEWLPGLGTAIFGAGEKEDEAKKGTNGPEKREGEALKAKSKAELGLHVQVIGLHAAPEVGLRVRPVQPGLAHSGNGPGVVSRVEAGGRGCWVRWECDRDVECGVYKCGEEGVYTLKLQVCVFAWVHFRLLCVFMRPVHATV